MTGDDQDDTSAAREAVVVARRDAAVAQARLAEASVRYADARIAGDIAAGVGSGRRPARRVGTPPTPSAGRPPCGEPARPGNAPGTAGRAA